MRSYFVFLISCLFIFAVPVFAASDTITVSPPFQYLSVTASPSATTYAERIGLVPTTHPLTPVAGNYHIDQASVEYGNHTTTTAHLKLSLASIQATDLYGRLVFNAPLPQTIIPATDNFASIIPTEFTLAPGAVATASVLFDPVKIVPGKTAFLLLANIVFPNATPPAHSSKQAITQIEQYIGSAIVIRDPVNTVPHLELKQFDWLSLPITFSLPDFITLGVKNSGSSPGEPEGLILITDSFHRELMRGPVNDATTVILPGSERLVYTHLKPSLPTFPISFCTLQLVGYDELKQSSFSATKSFVYLNPLACAGIVLGLLLVLYLIKRIKKQ